MKKGLRIIGFLVIVVAVVITLCILTEPKRADEIAQDNTHSEHEGLFELAKNSIDVLYIGSSHTYSAISPEDIFHDYGITGYVQASSAQKIWQTYYYLEEALLTQNPKVVVVETLRALDGEPQLEAFNREAIDQMKISRFKYESAWLAHKLNPEVENFWSYFLPVLRYHDRWNELEEADYKHIFMPANATAKGFLARTKVVPGAFNEGSYTSDWESVLDIPQICDEYLGKIKATCDAKGIELILLKVPTNGWNLAYSCTVQDWADRNGVKFIDFNTDNELTNMVNIDWNLDTIDGGYHLNYAGAMKISSWMGQYLKDNYEFEDKRNKPEYDNWSEDYIYYKRCVENYELTEISDIDEYISCLNDGYISIVSVNNPGPYDATSGLESLKLIGLSDAFIENACVQPNVAVIYGNRDNLLLDIEKTNDQMNWQVSEYCQDYEINQKIIPTGTDFDIIIKSKKDDNAFFSVIYDNEEKAAKENGLYFVIFDSITGKYVETSIWNPGADGVFHR